MARHSMGRGEAETGLDDPVPRWRSSCEVAAILAPRPISVNV